MKTKLILLCVGSISLFITALMASVLKEFGAAALSAGLGVIIAHWAFDVHELTKIIELEKLARRDQEIREANRKAGIL